MNSFAQFNFTHLYCDKDTLAFVPSGSFTGYVSKQSNTVEANPTACMFYANNVTIRPCIAYIINTVNVREFNLIYTILQDLHDCERYYILFNNTCSISLVKKTICFNKAPKNYALKIQNDNTVWLLNRVRSWFLKDVKNFSSDKIPDIRHTKDIAHPLLLIGYVNDTSIHDEPIPCFIEPRTFSFFLMSINTATDTHSYDIDLVQTIPMLYHSLFG